jgi:hypothetical protein
VSAKKTEVLHIGFTDHPALTLPSGEIITESQDFRYLGSLVASPEDVVADRRAQAWRATNQLSPIFCSAAANSLKIRLFRAAVEPHPPLRPGGGALHQEPRGLSGSHAQGASPLLPQHPLPGDCLKPRSGCQNRSPVSQHHAAAAETTTAWPRVESTWPRRGQCARSCHPAPAMRGLQARAWVH